VDAQAVVPGAGGGGSGGGVVVMKKKRFDQILNSLRADVNGTGPKGTKVYIDFTATALSSVSRQ
jgi:hypothetical protein